MPTYLFIVDTKVPFTGSCLNVMIEGNPIVELTKLTFEEYNTSKGGGLVLLTWDEYNTKYRKPFENNLCTPFKEISEDAFEMGLCQVPPLKWKHRENFDSFFQGECTTGSLYGFYFKDLTSGKYYSGLRSIHLNDDDLISEMKQCLLTP